LVTFFFLLLALIGTRSPLPGSVKPLIKIPLGSPTNIDGVLNPGEWRGAADVAIRVESGWTVKVLLKHDAQNLYFAFEGIEHAGKRMFPEIMLDPERRGGEKWSPGQWWLHVSNNLCEGNGEYNVYERGGAFQCAHTKPGWEANNPPRASEVIEIRVSFEKMDLAGASGKTIGLALDVTDATGGPDQVYRYWPESAEIAKPGSWGSATIEPGGD
jgi:hypothetical protein